MALIDIDDIAFEPRVAPNALSADDVDPAIMALLVRLKKTAERATVPVKGDTTEDRIAHRAEILLHLREGAKLEGWSAATRDVVVDDVLTGVSVTVGDKRGRVKGSTAAQVTDAPIDDAPADKPADGKAVRA